MKPVDPETRLSRTVRSVPPSAIRRFFDLCSEMKGDAISLSIGEPDFVTPWAVREAGIYSLEQGHTHYSPNQGFSELREEIALYLSRRFNLEYDPKRQVLVTVGGSEAIDLACRALLDPGDEVVIPEPCFVAYRNCVLLSGGVPVSVPCLPEDGFRLRPEALRAALTPRTKMVMLGFPNNPTGAVLSREDLAPLVDLLLETEAVVLSDELYAELTYRPEGHVSIASFPGMPDRTLVVNGFSKAFAMTGWRLGYLCGPESLVGPMNKIHQYAIMSAPTTAQYAAAEALRTCEREVRDMAEEYDRRRRTVLRAVREAGLPCVEPEGAFYVFPDIRPTGLSSTEFCERLLAEKKVAIVPGNAFGACGEGFVRICYAYSIDRIRDAMGRLRDFVAGV